ncbi:Gfo/Idh/MocA family protein [Ornithobacterium rhinotracheale]|uniref:Gfo/Idh/MocA family protein n=1 Tax=Ornithobacterium rhinotracheale TaxID=28251 RepID=UPI001FF4DCB1|nr:Gfo/Idh/MocA family oxidoreductase [Ornithobacterium rhinotracheale]MCK0206374.1 Gfo/Idh/MocA family oxidoreductase [Ornithobacterium rhinotracheale]
MRKFSIYGIFACIFALIFSCAEQKVATTPAKKGGVSPIVLPVPERAPGQTDVINLVTTKLETVRVGFVGLGMRGPGAVERFTQIPGTEIVALCDIEKNRVEKGQEILDKAGKKRAAEYYGSTEAYKKMCERDDIDLIYIVTDWKYHVPIALYAMEHGKHVAVEVPAAMNMKDIWALIDTSERTRKHCMMLENCVYDFFELTTLNMAQKGVFGEVLHTEGSYIHNLKDFWKAYYKNWRLDYNKDFRGDVYPTHGIGPACQLLDIHRGDRMTYLVSMDTKPVNGPAAWKDMFGTAPKDYKNGDHTMTMIRTENGKTIQIQHNVVTPRPYSRMYQLTGTKGFANKYPVQGYALEEVSEDLNPDHEKLDAHGFVPEDVKKALMDKYKHPILVELEEKAKKVGGHGGMDFIMDYRLVYCLQNGLPLDMDVYDLAEWSCLTELSALSIENGSAPVAIPDFTRGAWKKVKGYRHAFANDWAKK